MKIYYPSVGKRINKWEDLYINEGYRWGILPSLCAHIALADIDLLTKKSGLLLDLGCGYGRDVALFTKMFPEMSILGLEPTKTAVDLAKFINPKSNYNGLICMDVFDYFRRKEKSQYDVIFANYFIHLFSENEQYTILNLIRDRLSPKGVVIFSWLSNYDRHYGKGKKICNGSYHVYRDIPWRFVNVKDVEKMISSTGMRILKIYDYVEVELIKGKADRVNSIYTVFVNDSF